MLKRVLVALALLLPTPALADFEFTDLTCESTTTTGTSTLNLGGAATGYLGLLAAGIDSGDTVPYQIRSSDNKFETGIGTFTDASPDTLARTTVQFSSDGVGTALTLPAGTHRVCVGPIASIWTGGNVWTFDIGTTGIVKSGTVELGHATDTTLSRSAAGTLAVEGTNVVEETRTLTGGTGIAALGDLSADRTVTFDATEISSLTWGGGSFTTMAFNAGATDPVFTFGSNSLAISSAIVSVDQQLNPDADGGADLGTGTLAWDDLFLDTGATINFDNGDVLITHAANDLDFSGVTGDYSFDDAIVPSADNTIALGSAAATWSQIDVTTVDLGNNTDTTLTRGAAGEPEFEGKRVFVQCGSSTATTSGDDISLTTSLPSAAQVIFVMLDGVSTSGTDDILVQLGDSGGVETTGYSSWGTIFVSGAATATASSTAGFNDNVNTAATISYGHFKLTKRVADTTWVASWSLGLDETTDGAGLGGGSKATSATTDRVTLATSASGTFDAGSARVCWMI